MTTGEHIDAVAARLEDAAGADADAWWLKLAVRFHEEPPHAAAASVARAGYPEVADRVRAVLERFGRVWKVSDPAELEAFARDSGDVLRPLLLFELAHEGSATEAMIQAARFGGVEQDLLRGAERLFTASRLRSTRASTTSEKGATRCSRRKSSRT